MCIRDRNSCVEFHEFLQDHLCLQNTSTNSYILQSGQTNLLISLDVEQVTYENPCKMELQVFLEHESGWNLKITP